MAQAANTPIEGSFEPARAVWLGNADRIRNAIRQEMIFRQLCRHLPATPATVLDVGAGQGTQSIRLARAGYRVLAVEPDARMREVFGRALLAEPAEVRERISVRTGAVGQLAQHCAGQRFDGVLLLGVLMYLPSWRPVLAELAAHVADGGILAVAARTTVSALWRPAARQDWLAAAAALAEFDVAATSGRDMPYRNEIGAPAQAQDRAALVAAAEAAGLQLEDWYGVRVAADLAELDPAPPQDQAEWDALLLVEERLGSMDPFRQLAQLAHLIWRRPA
ncbi:MAG TPA: methyltransferase domain-containing protein [Jatrophihabitans sp.]|nr:methyltransferase domain-containing protein [Jatrophihabitans sp.]